jgi:hypothetical protein
MMAYRDRPQGLRGDPVKGARAILHIADLAEPPFRLLLGTDAVTLAQVVAARRASEDEKWRDLSRSTDFDGMGDFADTELGKMLTQPG